MHSFLAKISYSYFENKDSGDALEEYLFQKCIQDMDDP